MAPAARRMSSQDVFVFAMDKKEAVEVAAMCK